MRVLISADMEGISGITHTSFLAPDRPNWSLGQEYMVSDVNAAIEGAFAGGATAVVVRDAHGGGLNIRLKDLDPRAQLLAGSSAPLSMMTGVEHADLAMLVGYHAHFASDTAILDHTFDVQIRLWINGVEVGETGLNGALAGHFGVPVGLVTGDQAVTAEAKALLGAVETVQVKEAFGRQSGLCLHPQATYPLIKEAAKRSVARHAEFHPYVVGTPIEMRMEFLTSQMAQRAMFYPYAERASPRAVRCTAENMDLAFKAFYCIATLTGISIW
ncbi:MAG: M55 family metallopeptidase [Bacillota bacterium]